MEIGMTVVDTDVVSENWSLDIRPGVRVFGEQAHDRVKETFTFRHDFVKEARRNLQSEISFLKSITFTYLPLQPLDVTLIVLSVR
jgi:hypothetical protein